MGHAGPIEEMIQSEVVKKARQPDFVGCFHEVLVFRTWMLLLGQ